MPRLDDYATEAIGLIKSKAREEINSWGEPALESVDITPLVEPGCFILHYGFSRQRDVRGKVEFRHGDLKKAWLLGG